MEVREAQEAGGAVRRDSHFFTQAKRGTCTQVVQAALALRLRQQRGSYIDRLSAGVLDSDPGLLNHVQIGPCHHQRGVATEKKTNKNHRQAQFIPQV